MLEVGELQALLPFSKEALLWRNPLGTNVSKGSQTPTGNVCQDSASPQLPGSCPGSPTQVKARPWRCGVQVSPALDSLLLYPQPPFPAFKSPLLQPLGNTPGCIPPTPRQGDPRPYIIGPCGPQMLDWAPGAAQVFEQEAWRNQGQVSVGEPSAAAPLLRSLSPCFCLLPCGFRGQGTSCVPP